MLFLVIFNLYFMFFSQNLLKMSQIVTKLPFNLIQLLFLQNFQYKMIIKIKLEN